MRMSLMYTYIGNHECISMTLPSGRHVIWCSCLCHKNLLASQLNITTISYFIIARISTTQRAGSVCSVHGNQCRARVLISSLDIKSNVGCGENKKINSKQDLCNPSVNLSRAQNMTFFHSMYLRRTIYTVCSWSCRYSSLLNNIKKY